MNETDLGQFLSTNFGIDVLGGRVLSPQRLIDQDARLLAFEWQRVGELRTQGYTTFPLNTQEGKDYLMALGVTTTLQLALPIRRADGSAELVYATVTPDTDYYSGKIRFAYLGKLLGKNLWKPDHLDPQSGRSNWNDISIYLSGANQLCTVGDHNSDQQIEIVDPRHLLNAMAELNSGSHAHGLIQQTPQDHRAHIGDSWEQHRQFLPTISSQNPQNMQTDLVWAPVSFTKIYGSSESLPFAAVITADMVDGDALAQGHIAPVRSDVSGALEMMQQMGFATLISKNATDAFARKVEQGVV